MGFHWLIQQKVFINVSRMRFNFDLQLVLISYRFRVQRLFQQVELVQSLVRFDSLNGYLLTDLLCLAVGQDLVQTLATVLQPYFCSQKVVLVRDYLLNLDLGFFLRLDIPLVVNKLLQFHKVLYHILLVQISFKLQEVLVEVF